LKAANANGTIASDDAGHREHTGLAGSPAMRWMAASRGALFRRDTGEDAAVVETTALTGGPFAGAARWRYRQSRPALKHAQLEVYRG
jgi:hypothetical protein